MLADMTQKLLVSLGRACAQPAEQTAGKVDLVKFQLKETDLKDPRDEAVAPPVLQVTCTPERPPWKSWLKSEEKVGLQESVTGSVDSKGAVKVMRGNGRSTR